MDNAALGRRLKAARLSKKMTQSEVVGDFITRNMLSQIESGSATPSMKTLEYLADVLEIPMDKLLSDADSTEPPEQTALHVLTEAKKLFKAQQFQELLALQDTSGLLEDEMNALYGMAHLALAQELSSGTAEELQTAIVHARSAAQAAARGIYANAAVAEQAQQLMSSIAQYLSEYYSSLAAGGIGTATRKFPVS